MICSAIKIINAMFTWKAVVKSKTIELDLQTNFDSERRNIVPCSEQASQAEGMRKQLKIVLLVLF
jgi:hypothetical protein